VSVYPKYQECDGDWIIKIPASWRLVRGKYLFEIKKRIVGKIGDDVLSITQKGIKIKDIKSGDGQLSMDYSKYQIVEPGDFAMNHMDLLTGYVDISKYRGVTSPDYRVFSCKEKVVCSRFYLYVFQMGYTNKIFFKYGQGASHLGRWRLPTEGFNNFWFPCPPNEDKETIVNFLDYEIGRIDTLIEKQQQLIKLLKEKRQAMISHAVNKGLSPNALMFDSGVEWLGEVPEHWSTIPLKLVVRTRKGVAFKSVDFTDTGIRVVKASDIKQKTIRATDVFLPENFEYEYPKALLNSGDIILSTVGSNPDVKNSAVGQIGMVPEELTGTLLNQNTVVFDPNEAKVLREYLFYILQMEGYRDHLDLHAHGTANQSSLSISDMLNFSICFPPIEEQREICTYLREQQQKLSDLELRSGDSEALLRERRTALISAAVTGKIDVRHWQTPEPSNKNNKEVAA